MNNKHFRLRLQASYESDKDTPNNVKELSVDNLVDGKRENLDLNLRTPGFLMYLNALFSCQHLYMRKL